MLLRSTPICSSEPPIPDNKLHSKSAVQGLGLKHSVSIAGLSYREITSQDSQGIWTERVLEERNQALWERCGTEARRPQDALHRQSQREGRARLRHRQEPLDIQEKGGAGPLILSEASQPSVSLEAGQKERTDRGRRG